MFVNERDEKIEKSTSSRAVRVGKVTQFRFLLSTKEIYIYM